MLIVKIKIVILFVAVFTLSCKDENIDKHSELLEKEIAASRPVEFKEFYFVGNYSNKPSIYRYDVTANKTKVFWHDDDEKVIDLLVNEKRNSAYFITKRKQRLKSSQPAIERGKLYHIDFESQKVVQITQLEDGIQIIPYWMDDNRFALVINSIDKTIASYINKNTQLYNRFGKLLSDQNEIFDLTKHGYPVTRLPSPKFTSPNGLFSIKENNDSILVVLSTRNAVLQTGLTNQRIRNIGWAENNKHVILLTSEIESSDNKAIDKTTTTLVIYDLQAKKIIKSFTQPGLKRFVLIGDFLIFESGFGKDSTLEIFSLKSLEEYKKIKIAGGCGIRNIPEP